MLSSSPGVAGDMLVSSASSEERKTRNAWTLMGGVVGGEGPPVDDEVARAADDGWDNRQKW
jgi:hypothetical protein